MNTDSPETTAGTDRREALRNLAGGALALVALGTSACTPAASAASATPAPRTSFKSEFDMSWQQRVTRRRRTVFDTNDVSGGAGLAFVGAYLGGAKEAYGDPDASTVLVHRHTSVPVIMGDELWKRLALGESLKLKDPTTGETALRNPFNHYTPGDRYGMTGADGTVDALMKAGTIMLACNRALMGFAWTLSSKEKIDRIEAHKQIIAGLIPGVYVVPNGIFGVCAAQEVGCGYITVRTSS